MKKAKITTVIPTYRRPQLLKRAIRSAMHQHYRDICITVYDNASDDETELVVRELMKEDDRIAYVKNEENIGGIANIWKGVMCVQTDYYSILSDDDILLENFYSDAMLEIGKNPSLGFVCLKTIVIDIRAQCAVLRNLDWNAGNFKPSVEVVQKMKNSHFTSTGVLFSKRIRDLIGPFEASGDDGLYLTMAASVAPFSVVDIAGAVWNYHEDSYSATIEFRGSDASKVMKQYVDTVEQCMSLPIPISRKTQLLSIVSNSYHKSLEKYIWSAVGDPSRVDEVKNLEFLLGRKISLLGHLTPVKKISPILSNMLLFFFKCAVYVLRNDWLKSRSVRRGKIPRELEPLVIPSQSN